MGSVAWKFANKETPFRDLVREKTFLVWPVMALQVLEQIAQEQQKVSDGDQPERDATRQECYGYEVYDETDDEEDNGNPNCELFGGRKFHDATSSLCEFV